MHFDDFATLVLNTSDPVILVEGRRSIPEKSAHPEAGGSGHTIRACRLTGIPVVFQNHWETWLTSEP